MVAKAKLEREQTHSKAKDTLEEIIKDQTVKDSVKQDAVDKLAMLSEQMEMETAAQIIQHEIDHCKGIVI